MLVINNRALRCEQPRLELCHLLLTKEDKIAGWVDDLFSGIVPAVVFLILRCQYQNQYQLSLAFPIGAINLSLSLAYVADDDHFKTKITGKPIIDGQSGITRSMLRTAIYGPYMLYF
ncbi:unnamed protein product [Prunus armeniaca]